MSPKQEDDDSDARDDEPRDGSEVGGEAPSAGAHEADGEGVSESFHGQGVSPGAADGRLRDARDAIIEAAGRAIFRKFLFRKGCTSRKGFPILPSSTTGTQTMNIEQQLEARQNRRMAAQDRFLGRIEKREADANAMIGELNSGKLYVWPVGGRYREGTRSELIAFLIRNNYA
jgi:hypothetical protein